MRVAIDPTPVVLHPKSLEVAMQPILPMSTIMCLCELVLQENQGRVERTAEQLLQMGNIGSYFIL